MPLKKIIEQLSIHSPIFPWNENFDTGIAIIDEQHTKLVELLNTLACHLAFGSDAPELNRIFAELSDYASYHFKTEEDIWLQYLPDDPNTLQHAIDHQSFITEVTRMKHDLDTLSSEKVVDEIVSFLTHWLAFHILESDKYMAKVVLSLQNNLALPEAKVIANEHMNGAMRVLIETVLKMYDSLSTRTLELMREIAERQRTEQNLQLFKNVVNTTLEAIFITDADSNIIDTNPAFCAYLAATHEALMGKNIVEMMPKMFAEDKKTAIFQEANEKGHWSGELINRNINNEIEAIWLALSVIKNDEGHISQYVGILSSVSQLVQQQQSLELAANYDALTGLPNRRLLQDRLDQAISRCLRSTHALAVCFLDLDGFKLVNDVLGHDAGDEVLRMVSKRLTNLLRGEDTVVRMGGDEFVLLLGELKDKNSLIKVLDRLLVDIAQPIAYQGMTANVTASIGVTLYPADPCSPDKLVHHADAAMYISKKNGKSQFQFYV